MAPFTLQEIHVAINAMNKNSSPGPDGFGPGFYAAAWDTVAARVEEFAAAFHERRAMLGSLNRSFIVMLPKHSTCCCHTRRLPFYLPTKLPSEDCDD